LANVTRHAAAEKASQRERLVEAMTQAAARFGHKDASVARVVEQAGVSRATFYKHFADKEACFLAAFEVAAERIEAALRRIDAEQDPSGRAPAVLEDLLQNGSRDPAAAHILLLDARAGGREARLAHEHLMLNAVEMLEGWLCAENEEGWRLAISGRAVMEGVIGVLTNRAFRGEAAQLGELHGDLLAWIVSYAARAEKPRLSLEDWRRLGSHFVETGPQPEPAEEATRKLPRGRAALPVETVAGEQRERILYAMTQLARTKIYTEITVADVVKEAGVTREAFYRLFRCKEEAFLAAQSTGLESSIAVAASGFFTGESWSERVWGGLESLLTFTATQPDLIYLDVIESPAVGAAALRRSLDNLMAYTLFLEDGYRQRPRAERLPRLCSEAIAASVLGMMRRVVYEGRTARMRELLPQAAYVALAPFIGPAAAMEEVETKVAAIAGTPTA
jgi:AcrR family transcriptional regulator